jgi:hypothetical protein
MSQPDEHEHDDDLEVEAVDLLERIAIALERIAAALEHEHADRRRRG